jgi:phosphate-selective porin OprO/OprP
MKPFLSSFRVGLPLVALASIFSIGRATAADSEIEALREQIQLLDQKLRVLERKAELQDEAAAAAAQTAPKLTLSDKAFVFASSDAANSLRVGGLVQMDSRLFFQDGGLTNNAFVLRRARIVLESTLDRNYSFQLVPDFGGSAVTLFDANFGVTIDPALQLKFGKFKSPIGLEQLQAESWTFFDERSLVTNLVPNRDLGVQASGDLFNGTLAYAAGIFGGVADAGNSTNTDFDNEKDFAGRVMSSPFKNEPDSVLQGLSAGVSASLGREKTASGRTSGYKTDGQQTFFSYAAATVADGETWRVSPQFDYRLGSFGAMGEYVISVVNVRPSLTGPKAELQNRAWQLSAGYVLTGEDSSYAGVVPRNNFDYKAGTWGAFEVTARLATLKIDDDAFPLYASAATNPDEAKAFGVGLNWYLSKAVAFKFDYYQTQFGFNSAAPAVSANPLLRQDEKAFISRFQITF